MVIFHSYVSLPEGNNVNLGLPYFQDRYTMVYDPPFEHCFGLYQQQECKHD